MNEGNDILPEFGGAKKSVVIDVRPHVGKNTTIEKYNVKKGKWGYYIILKTIPVATHESANGNIEIRGSRIFNMQLDGETNKLVWPEGGKLDNFLKKHKANNPEELIGKEVMLGLVTKEDGNEFLGIE